MTSNHGLKKSQSHLHRPSAGKQGQVEDEEHAPRKSNRKSIGNGPVKLSFVTLHIPKNSVSPYHQTHEKRGSEDGGELRVIIRGMDTSETDILRQLHEEEEMLAMAAAATAAEQKKSMSKTKTEAVLKQTEEDKRISTTAVRGTIAGKSEKLSEGGDDSVGDDYASAQGGSVDDKDSALTEILGPNRESELIASPKNSMVLLREDEMDGEGAYDMDEGMYLTEAETTSSFQITFKPSALLRKSVDSQEYALKHGLHIAGQDKEEDLAFEKEEPYKTEEEINEELMKQHEHHTLLERESVVRETLIVWENISRYIIRKMKDGIGVRIPGLGTFTQAMLPNHLIMERKESDRYTLRRLRKFPIFKICPHVKEMNGLSEENYLYQANIPAVCLSTAAVAAEAKLPRGLVQGIITETLIAFARGVSTNKDVEFPFPYIGKMYVKERKVYMFFYRQFCEGLSFDFGQQVNMISSVILGQMTPLHYHRPTMEVKSAFHYGDLRSVEDKMRSRTRAYSSGDLIRDDAEDRCKFMQKLFTHSNLPFDCSCCPKDKSKSTAEDGNDNDDTGDPSSDFLCEFSKNYDRIERACCMQPGGFSFQQPDGSTFTPEPLYRTAKTGNPVLDRLTDDRCLLHQALSCWMKRDFLQNLGPKHMAKHFDRDYFRRMSETRRKSYLEAQPLSSSYADSSPETDARYSVEEVERKSRESAFYRRLEACLIALEQADEQIDMVEEPEQPMLAQVLSEEGEMSDTTGESRDRRKSKRYNNFEVFSGLYYNLLDNDRAKRNESDFNLLSKTPSTSSVGGSPVIRSKSASSASSTTTQSSAVCWEQPVSAFLKQTNNTNAIPPTPNPTPAQPPPPPLM